MELPEYIIKAFKLKEVKENSTITYEETETIPISWLLKKQFRCYHSSRKIKQDFDKICRLIDDWRKEND